MPRHQQEREREREGPSTWFYRSLVDPFEEKRASSSSIFLSHESLIERLSTVELSASSVCRQIRNHLRWNRREYWSNSIRVIHREMKRIQVRCTRVDSGGGSVCRYESRSKPLPRGILTFFSPQTFRIFYSKLGSKLWFQKWIIDYDCRCFIWEKIRSFEEWNKHLIKLNNFFVRHKVVVASIFKSFALLEMDVSLKNFRSFLRIPIDSDPRRGKWSNLNFKVDQS